MKRKSRSLRFTLLFALCSLLFAASCTFDYGESEISGIEIPDLIMENVTYVRIRAGSPQARFTAERAERFESRGAMHLFNFSFEQYGDRGEEVNASGRAGFASVNINTTDIVMSNGVTIEVDIEDIIIETDQLEWLDASRLLFTRPDSEVNILQPNGTNFTGIGLRVEARRRSWEFLGNVSGTFIHDGDEDEEEQIVTPIPEDPAEEKFVDDFTWEEIWEEAK